MTNDAFERAFDEFLEHDAFDRAQEALFTALRAAFLAGWTAAARADLKLIQKDEGPS